MSDRKSRGDNLLKSAIHYAEQKWAVLPLHFIGEDGACSCDKGFQCDQGPGKHPRLYKGLKEATATISAIERFPLWGESNIGIATGSESGIFVIDIDINKGGEESFADLIREHEKLPETVEQISGTGGRHFLFRYPTGVKIGNKTNWLTGVDIRGEGGYIVAAPSIHKCGKEYAWEGAEYPLAEQVAEAPPWLIEMLAKPKITVATPVLATVTTPAIAAVDSAEDREAKILAATAYLANIPGAIEGQGGDQHTFKVAGHILALLDFDEQCTFDVMNGKWNPKCTPPWSADGLMRKINSSAKNGTPRAPKQPYQTTDEIVNDIDIGLKPTILSKPAITDTATPAIGITTPMPKPKRNKITYKLTPLNTIKAEKTEWLWEGRIPLGKVSQFVSDGGFNKSTVAYDLAARVSAGMVAPLSTVLMPKGKVIIIMGLRKQTKRLR